MTEAVSAALPAEWDVGADYRYIPRKRFASLSWYQCECVRPLIIIIIIIFKKTSVGVPEVGDKK